MEPIHMLSDDGSTLTSYVENNTGRAMAVTLTWRDAAQLDEAVATTTAVLSDWASQDRSRVPANAPAVHLTETFGVVYRLVGVAIEGDTRVGYYETAHRDGMKRVDFDLEPPMWSDSDGLLWTEKPELRHARLINGSAVHQTPHGPPFESVAVGEPVGLHPTRGPVNVPVFLGVNR